MLLIRQEQFSDKLLNRCPSLKSFGCRPKTKSLRSKNRRTYFSEPLNSFLGMLSSGKRQSPSKTTKVLSVFSTALSNVCLIQPSFGLLSQSWRPTNRQNKCSITPLLRSLQIKPYGSAQPNWRKHKGMCSRLTQSSSVPSRN